MALGDCLCYPAAAAGAVLSSTGGAGWVYGSLVTLVPASTISAEQQVYGLWIEPETAFTPDNTGEGVFSIEVGGVEKLVLSHSHRFDTAVACYLTSFLPVTLAEPLIVPANSLVQVKVATSGLAGNTYRVKMQYIEGAPVTAGIPSLLMPQRIAV